MTYHSILQMSSEFINALKRAHELCSSVTAELGDGHEVFPYSVFYVHYEQYLTIIPNMLENIGLALCKEFGFTFILYQLYSSCSVCLFLSRSVVIKIIPSLLSLPPSLPTSLSFFPSSLLPPSLPPSLPLSFLPSTLLPPSLPPSLSPSLPLSFLLPSSLPQWPCF